MIFIVPSREQYIPVEIIRKRELKWLSMLKKWETNMKSKQKKVYPANFFGDQTPFLCD